MEILDLGFFFARVLRFYSLNHSEVLQLPVRTFWFLNEQIDRLAAEESLRGIDLALAGQMDGKGVKQLSEGLQRQMGLIAKVEEKPDFAALQRIAGKNKAK